MEKDFESLSSANTLKGQDKQDEVAPGKQADSSTSVPERLNRKQDLDEDIMVVSKNLRTNIKKVLSLARESGDSGEKDKQILSLLKGMTFAPIRLKVEFSLLFRWY